MEPPVEWMMRWIGEAYGTVYNISSSKEVRIRPQTMQRTPQPLRGNWNIQEIEAEGKRVGQVAGWPTRSITE
jgi:hypothetical protein